MAIRPTVQIGDPVIRRRADEVADISANEVQETIQDLIDTMRAEELVGMAAPQIGKGLRIFVSEIRSTIYRVKEDHEMDDVRICINPVIIKKSEEQEEGREGCGSVAHAGLFGDVRRSRAITVQAQDREGTMFEIEAEGLLARIMQHEIDHLDGMIFLDKLDSMQSLVSKETVLEEQKKKV